MTLRAAKLIQTNIDTLSDIWLDANSEVTVVHQQIDRIGDNEVKKIITQILQALALVLDEKEKVYLFEPTGIVYKKAKFLGELRRAQGFELEQVLQEYLILRHELWRLLREKLHSEEIDVFELEERLNFCLMNILKATINSFHHRQTKHLREQAITDSLTGLFNRRQFDKIINHELYRANRYERDLALGLLDIDHFKMYNDVYGHSAGDYALEEVSNIIRQFLRVSDAAARYGGEEFALILPETNQDQANRVCSRIRRAVERHPFEIDGKKTNITISVGIACYPQDSKETKELIDFSDKAMYQAKKMGRNRVMCAAKNSSIKTKWLFNKKEKEKVKRKAKKKVESSKN